MPRFSIIIPCFQAEATLGRTLESLQAQSCPDWEALCIDDGSTDGTRALLEAAAARDPRLRVIRNIGKGPSAARNLGAFLAEGEILAFCDADDLWSSDKLAHLRTAFADPDCAGAFGRVAFFREEPADARSISTLPEGPLTIAMLLGENPVCTMSNIALRRPVFLASGGLDPAMVHNEDLDWLIRLVGEGASLRPLNAVLVWYRASPLGLSADLEAMARGRAQALASAARYGFSPDAGAEAVHLRYLARRALRVGRGDATALKLAVRGLRQAPRSFLLPAHRGCATLAAAVLAPVLPPVLRRTLFTR
ncbi:glycosyltransferase [Pseudooceanicola sp. CBS1P-1]|uniref:glycosyltransferase family 2 protein n=1 Tax=Pseudooceanicola endophyticus TaxID=2841273 RepID=UPI001C013E84|nr:glycosyltransferase family 2 protein [Pseudooceanicola endophyticus]MBT9382259.1 glycosyltransferase [Pseudooceanicola endophyticus]